MPLTAPRYLYKMQGDPDTYEVTVFPADQTVAEQTAQRMMLGPVRDAPLTHTAVWVWAAAKRAGHHTMPWPEFLAGLEAFDAMEDEPAPLDPTQPVEHTG